MSYDFDSRFYAPNTSRILVLIFLDSWYGLPRAFLKWWRVGPHNLPCSRSCDITLMCSPNRNQSHVYNLSVKRWHLQLISRDGRRPSRTRSCVQIKRLRKHIALQLGKSQSSLQFLVLLELVGTEQTNKAVLLHKNLQHLPILHVFETSPQDIIFETSKSKVWGNRDVCLYLKPRLFGCAGHSLCQKFMRRL